jgi:hypothetical protein
VESFNYKGEDWVKSTMKYSDNGDGDESKKLKRSIQAYKGYKDLKFDENW